MSFTARHSAVQRPSAKLSLNTSTPAQLNSQLRCSPTPELASLSSSEGRGVESGSQDKPSRRGLGRQHICRSSLKTMQMKKTRATDYRSLPSLWSHSLHHELELTTDTTQDRKNEHCLLPAAGLELRDARKRLVELID